MNTQVQPAGKCAWLPIATAPRDGLLVLLCTDGGIVFVGKFQKHLQMWVCDDGRERFRTVTHWMPTPKPPTEEKTWSGFMRLPNLAR